MTTPDSPDLSLLRQRADLLRQLRCFFDERDFLEVQPPCLSRGCIVDPYIDPIIVSSRQFRLGHELPARYYLQTSPEGALKRMLAAGAPSIYSIGPVFRSGERGAGHNIEFTMLEWYQVGADAETGITLLGDLATSILQQQRYDVRTYRQVFERFLNFDPITAPLSHLQATARRLDASYGSENRDDLLDFLFSQSIQPHLGKPDPLVVRNYPLSQAALARPSSDDPACAARFELFAGGVELANGYDELQCPETYFRRAAVNNELRVAAGRDPIDVDHEWASAMHNGLPQCAGVALGVDRLLMVQTGVQSIDQVMPFSIESA